MQKIRVIHVLTDLNIGGAGRWFLNFLSSFNTEEFEIIAVLAKGGLLAEEVTRYGIEIILLDELKDKSFDKNSILPLKKIFKEKRPNIVHTHASLSARIAAKMVRIPMIIHTKHCMEEKSSFTPGIVKNILNRYYSDKIIAVSHAVADSMIRNGVDSRQVVVIYNGVQKIRELSYDKKQEVLLKYGANPYKKIVGIVARLEEVKDHETFIRAVKIIIEKRDDIQFLIIGDGSLKNNLYDFSQNIGIESGLIFTGFVKDIEELEGCLDLGIITSKQEALCLSILETMSIGIPAVGSNTGGIGEVIEDNKNGFLFEVGDYKKLALKIEEAFEEKNYKRLSENSKRVVEEKFSVEIMTEGIERLYGGGKR